MKSLPVKQGVTRSLMMVARLCVGVIVLITLLEEVVSLLAYYFA